MPYAPQYAEFVEAEIPSSKALIKPRNVYKLKTYRDVDGNMHNYAGSKAAYIFIIGILKGKVYALKISDVRPIIFWNWLKPLVKKDVVIGKKIKDLSDILVADAKPGNKIFENFVKNKTIYKIDPSAFRTYELSGLNSLLEIKFDLNYIKTFYKLKSDEINSEYKDPQVEAKKTAKVRNEEQTTKESQPNSGKIPKIISKETPAIVPKGVKE